MLLNYVSLKSSNTLFQQGSDVLEGGELSFISGCQDRCVNAAVSSRQGRRQKNIQEEGATEKRPEKYY